MAWKLNACLLTALILQSASCLEDLLDQYVRHVETVNKIPPDQRYRHRTVSGQIKDSNKFYYDTVGFHGVHRAKRDSGNAYELYQWTHAEVLDGKGDVVLRWQPRHQEILFRVEARTMGYVGIGFSPDGGMQGADIVLGWVDDRSGQGYLLDCHGVSKSQGSAPVKDEVDNYTLMRAIQNDSHTIIEFRRVLDTCDLDDYVLSADTVRVIWAIHDYDPRLGAEMVYHGEKRGTQSLHLLGPPLIARTDPPSHVRQWDVTLNNFEIRNNMNTMYWCKVFKAPTLHHKHHIIGHEPLISNNHTQFVHHMLLHDCELGDSIDVAKWDAFASQEGRPCYDSEMPPEWERCFTPLAAWAVGSKGENLPEHVGLPLAANKASYYMLEVHFDNPHMKKAVGRSGFRLHYTDRLRPNEGGMLVAGVALSALHFIPPMQAEYKSAGYCSTECTKKVFPKDGVNIVSVVMHSHLAGRRMRLRHVRGNRELSPIVVDNHYDFNYQQTRALSHEVTIMPGDGLVMECTYSTLKRTKPTLGGYSTNEEMCFAFVLHYPRTELSWCYSMPPIRYFFENLGVKEFYGKSMKDIENVFLQGQTQAVSSTSTTQPPLFPYSPGDEMSPEANRRAILAIKNAKDYTIEGEESSGNILEELVIKEPQEFQNKTFMAHLQSLPFNESLLTKRIEEYFYSGLHLTFCRKRDDTLAMREMVERFPNFTAYTENNESKVQCSYRMRKSYSSAVDKPKSVFYWIIACFVFSTLSI